MLPEAQIAQVASALGITQSLRQQTLTAGVLNQVVKLTAGEQHWVVKRMGNQQATGVNVAQQFALQQAISQQGIAPNPCWLSADARLWVETWVPSTLDVHALALSQQLHLLAQALATIHALPLPSQPPLLKLSQRWQHYLQVASLPRQHPLWHEVRVLLMSEGFASLEESSLCLCHHDLSLGHVLRRHPMIIVDWEYAACGHRFFDIACCALINQLSDAATQTLCEAYATWSGYEGGEVVAAVLQQLPMARMTSQLWQLACVAKP